MLDLKNDGITILRGFFEKETIENLRESAKGVFKIQFEHFGYSDYESEEGFKNSMIRLFEEISIPLHPMTSLIIEHCYF